MTQAASGTASAIIAAGEAQPARPWPRRALTLPAWRAMAEALAEEPTLALAAMWVDTASVFALFADEAAGAILPVSCNIEDGRYPALSPHRPAAAWFERMIHDLWGRVAEGGRDPRPWLDHGRWGITAPMAVRPGPGGGAPEPPEFRTAHGEDLHQLAVGPIHAGIIEPGHFRIHALGETVVRLEARLGYAHKGTLALMRGKSPRNAARFAARISGDATVAHAIAFAAAAEAALQTPAPPRAQALRGLMGELERIANHLGDVSAVCGDVALALPAGRFGLLREAVLRASATAFGHRLMMDCVIPGGVAADIVPGGPEALARALDQVAGELPLLVDFYDDHAGLTDRMVGTGVVEATLAARFGAGGVVGRASGRRVDARVAPGYPPYRGVAMAVLDGGDVDARVRVRLAELTESLRLARDLLGSLPAGGVSVPLPIGAGEGLGVAESRAGAVWHWLRLEGGLIAASFAADPAWLLWPLLEGAMAGTIVADFPLCNRSFGLSYSAVDL